MHFKYAPLSLPLRPEVLFWLKRNWSVTPVRDGIQIILAWSSEGHFHEDTRKSVRGRKRAVGVTWTQATQSHSCETKDVAIWT